MKPPFDDMYIDTAAIFQPGGNKIRMLTPTFRFITDDKERARISEEKRKQYKEIYDNHINPGQLFKPAGDKAITEVRAKITRLNPKTKTVSWKQTNFEELKSVYKYSETAKPAQGKWPVVAMIQLHLAGQILFI